MNQDRIIAEMQDGDMLDPIQLERLEQCFRAWANEPGSTRRTASRRRILLIFLIIRYTGAKLSEVLGLRPATDLDPAGQSVTFRSTDNGQSRRVAVSQSLAQEFATLLPARAGADAVSPTRPTDTDAGAMSPARPGADTNAGNVAQTRPSGPADSDEVFAVDPAYVRKKFYERAKECGFEKTRGGPEMLRKARAVELLRNNMPLPAVQRLLGHSSPNLTASRIAFSAEDMQEVTRMYMERESGCRTSARNSFFGKVLHLARDDVQTLVELGTADGDTVAALITNTSSARMGLKPGRLVTAEIKSPWLTLERCDRPGCSSAENQREGLIARVVAGAINSECAVRLPDGTELCAVLSSEGFKRLGLSEGDPVRVLFGAYAVILHLA